MKSKGFLFTMAVTVSILLVPIAGQTYDKVRFGTPVKVVGNYALPPLAAEDKGFWKAQGLEGKWIPFRGGARLHQAFAAGAVDLALTSATSSTHAIFKRVPEIMVAQTGSNVPFVIWVRADGRLKKREDLEGAIIGTKRLGGATYAFGRVIAKALGLEKKIKFVGGGSLSGELAAIKAGKIDGRVGDLLSGLPLKIKGELRVLVTVNEFLPSPWLDQVVIAHTRLTKDNPGLVKRAVKALRQSTDFTMKDREWSVAKLKSALRLPEVVAQEVYKLSTYGRDWNVNPKAAQNVRDFLAEYGIIPRDSIPPMKSLYLAGFVD